MLILQGSLFGGSVKPWHALVLSCCDSIANSHLETAPQELADWVLTRVRQDDQQRRDVVVRRGLRRGLRPNSSHYGLKQCKINLCCGEGLANFRFSTYMSQCSLT